MDFEKRLSKAAKESCSQHKHAMRYNPMIDQFKLGAKWALDNPDWIKISDSLPPKDEDSERDCSDEVLVFDGDFIYIDRYFFDNKEWRGSHRDYTHWMFLPKYPSLLK